jgi:hypothetical protein
MRALEAGRAASAPRTARKLNALRPKTHVGPADARRTPAIAGPTKRATWSERLFKATALSRSSSGTVEASMDWNAGKLSVPSVPPMNARTPMRKTVSSPDAQSTVRAIATPMFPPWKRRRILRRSKWSASTPAGSAKTRFGIVFRNPMIPSVAAEPPRRSTT